MGLWDGKLVFMAGVQQGGCPARRVSGKEGGRPLLKRHVSGCQREPLQEALGLCFIAELLSLLFRHNCFSFVPAPSHFWFCKCSSLLFVTQGKPGRLEPFLQTGSRDKEGLCTREAHRDLLGFNPPFLCTPQSIGEQEQGRKGDSFR